MGEWFSVWVMDVVRGWIATSEGGDPVKMTENQIAQYHAMKERHENEEQAFCRKVFHS